jgi:heme exporter protein A
MRQRLTLARALIHEPRLLLLDEPYTGLDQHGSRLLREILQGLKREGRTILLITHNLLEGLVLSSRVLIMNRGEIVHRADRSDVDEGEFENLYFRLIED